MSKQPKVDIQQELQATSYGQHREQVTQIHKWHDDEPNG